MGRLHALIWNRLLYISFLVALLVIGLSCFILLRVAFAFFTDFSKFPTAFLQFHASHLSPSHSVSLWTH